MTEFVSQVVMPKNIYVGDNAHVLYTFKTLQSADTLFDELISHGGNNRDGKSRDGRNINIYEIDLSRLGIDTDTASYTINKISLSKNQNDRQNDYVLDVMFQAWTPGQINLPPIDLAQSLYGDKANFSCVIFFEKIDVSSLTSTGDVAIHETGGPLLVPGTIYFVYALVTLALLVLVALSVFAVRFKAIRTAWRNFCAGVRLRLNMRRTLMRLDALLEHGNYNSYSSNIGDENAPDKNDDNNDGAASGIKMSDKDFCAELQQIVRDYLSVRYGFSFDSIVTSRLMAELMDVTGGTLSEHKENAAQDFVEVFHRADYVRFAENTLTYVPLMAGERQTLVSKAKNAVLTFEGEKSDD